jgi:hypothetical protein
MDMEARSLAPDKGRPLQNKVREYKADLTSLREQLKQAAAGRGAGQAAAAQQQLLRSGGAVLRMYCAVSAVVSICLIHAAWNIVQPIVVLLLIYHFT